MLKIIRGGQTTLHNIRMLRQVIASLLKTGMGVALLSVIYYLYRSPIRLYDLKTCLIFLYAKVLCDSGLGNNLIKITNLSGYKTTYRATEIANGYEVKRAIDNLLQLLYQALDYGINYGIIAASFLMFIFVVRGMIITRKKVLRGKEIVSPSKIKLKIGLHNLLLNLLNLENYLILFKHLLLAKPSRAMLSLFSSTKLGGIPYPKYSYHTHTIITGASGTGKTVLISDLIHQARKKQQKAIIYDKMGVYVKNFYDPKTDILLNPFDARSHNWDLIKECSSKIHSDNIASAFIPSKNSSDPFWENSARMLFSEVIKQAKDNEDLMDILFHSKDRLNEVIKSSASLQKTLSKESGKTTANILSVMYSYARSLEFLERGLLSQNQPSFSIREWIRDKDQKGFLIISSRADIQESLKPLLTAMFETAINSILSLPQNTNSNLWVFLDELPSLQYIPSLQSALAESRQFGTSFVLALQVMAQLKDIYGIHKAESVSGLCRNRVVFATADEDTANWCSNSLGKVELEEIQESHSYGAHEMRDSVNLNKQRQIRNLLLPSEIMNLENLHCCIRFGSGFGLTKVKLKPRQYAQKAESFIPIQELAGTTKTTDDSKSNSQSIEEKPNLTEEIKEALAEVSEQEIEALTQATPTSDSAQENTKADSAIEESESSDEDFEDCDEDDKENDRQKFNPF
jgi:type IV conjugative transfer system coupling protein TraD